LPDSENSESEALDYCFLLLTHIICADQQIHSREVQALWDLAAQAKVNPLTLQAAEQILAQDENCLLLNEVTQCIPVGQRSEALRQVLAIAYVDGFFSPLEREVVNQIAESWGIHGLEVEQMLEVAQGFGSLKVDEDDDQASLSIGARLLKGAESLLSRSLVNKLVELAPDNLGRQIERLQREVLLAGPEYDEAIQHCAKIAREDYKYAESALKLSYGALRDLGHGIQQVIWDIQQTTKGKGQQATAKEVAQQLEKTRQALSAEILHELEAVRQALRSKQRALNHFSIAFMGRTKAGKSTLHAVITGEGWEAIGVGKQRTTRYNRVYEWKNIRIIDTPGIGAPGGKTDEEIARSVIDEADIICYVVTNDSIQETEFNFLQVLKEKTKPLIVLLNLQYNLRDQRRLKHFLDNPERLFAHDGSSGIGGHLKRIERYAQEHYANDYLDVLPVMLLAAQLARESEHQSRSKQLFQSSRIQDFLNSIRVSLIEHGAIRRSQTLLGSTVGSIDKPYKWISEEATAYQELAERLKEKQQELKQQLQKAERDACNKLRQKIKETFQDALNAVPSFAEEHWEAKESRMESGWKQKLRSIEFEQRLKIAPEEASQSFQREVQEALEEIGNELKLIAQLKEEKFSFSEQDTDDFGRQAIKFGGNILALVCFGAALFFPAFAPVLGIASILLGLGSNFSNFFKSREQKRREAVQNISTSLQRQLEEQQEKVLQQAKGNFEEYCQAVSKMLNAYFEELTQGIEGMAKQLRSTQNKLGNYENYLNRAYAKRIIDWAVDQYEPLTDAAISRKIRKVNRVFGKNIEILTTSSIPMKKSMGEIQKILQENVSIQIHKG
jgi:uncharacterized tellurite resistance protein B-like protein/GTP-binding protein EngB required for normal cell division